jgi:hypothetical protein
MEAIIQTINWLANVVFGGSLTAFYLMIYGDETKIVHKWPFVQNWTLRVGLIGMILGALFNVLTFSIPTLPEFVLNLGLAFVFLWAFIFHKKHLQKKSN